MRQQKQKTPSEKDDILRTMVGVRVTTVAIVAMLGVSRTVRYGRNMILYTSTPVLLLGNHDARRPFINTKGKKVLALAAIPYIPYTP